MSIGKFRHQICAATEYKKLSISDESAALLLASNGDFRHACYFIIQAMEKSIRAKIFNIVNPKIEYFREKNRTHSLESAIDFLIEIISTDKVIQQQISKQLNEHVLGNTQYNRLHNNLRYPNYFFRYDSYSMLDIEKKDFDMLKSRNDLLKVFLSELHKLP